MIVSEFGWVFIYVCAFGFTDFINERYIKTDNMYILFYFTIGLIGMYIIKKNKELFSI